MTFIPSKIGDYISLEICLNGLILAGVSGFIEEGDGGL